MVYAVVLSNTQKCNRPPPLPSLGKASSSKRARWSVLVLVLCLCVVGSVGEEDTYSWSDGEAIVLLSQIDRDHQMAE
jgi:hypothetical protein